ncbi:MAG TPA: M56 family metallopeptidase [Vicinamibacterales bacterium]|nr:M56 family metallopeptidase [Vicinamibacterales bacterium]
MTFELRLIVVVCAAFAVATLLGASLVPLVGRRAGRLAPAARADALLRARLLPPALGILTAALVAISWMRFEQRGLEATGLLLPGLAVLGVATIGASAVRLTRLLRLTERTVNGWLVTATRRWLPGLSAPAFVIDVPFPVVAVVGIWRPRLVVARAVLDACTAEELDAVIAHEQHHVARRDNLRRALLAAVPDPLASLPLSRRLLADWREATEDAADDAVDRLGPHGRPLLAQALIRVARLAPAGGWAGPLPASSLYRGEGLDRRVRRLLGTVPAAGETSPRWAAAGLGVAGILSLSALDRVHYVVELAVTYLP